MSKSTDIAALFDQYVMHTYAPSVTLVRGHGCKVWDADKKVYLDFTAGIIVDEPDYFNGTVVWNVTGPLHAREKGINIGYYNTTAYEGLVRHKRVELEIGRRYYFQPRYCMLQWRHCGLVNAIGKTKDGLRVRIEGLWIG